VDELGGRGRRVIFDRECWSGLEVFAALGVEERVPHAIEMRRWRLPMLLLVIGKGDKHHVRACADRAVAAEQIAIEIGEPGGMRRDLPAGRQIEEQRAAAQARLEVLLEVRRDESAELREQLPLAPG